VLLHGGFVHDRRSWHDAGYVARLSRGFFVLTVDLRGHGESERPRAVDGGGYEAAALVADVHAVLDAAGIDRAAVWGSALGAAVALRLARDGGRVTSAIAGGSAFGHWLSDEEAARWSAGAASLLGSPAVELDVCRGLLGALPHWPEVMPADVACPVLVYL